ncbi:MAG: hypothetical protein Q4F02_00080 [Candidatus Saccharibacteria bacterium]|nr:hypothetical protein [Candidatus Saccharibacteria bacterium]
MNKVKTTIIAAVFAVAGVMMLGPVASAKTTALNQADIDAMERFEKQMNEGAEKLKSAQTPEAVKMALASLAMNIDTFTRHNFSTKLGADYTAATNKYRDAVATVKQPLSDLRAAVNAGDPAAIQTQYQKFSATLTAAEKQTMAAADEINKAVEKANSAQSTPYLWALIATAVLAVASAAWAFMKHEATPELTKHRRGVALASIWPLLGAGITYGTFAFADKFGGKFYIMYGLILFGLVAYAGAVANYLKARKAGAGHSQTPPAMPQA